MAFRKGIILFIGVFLMIFLLAALPYERFSPTGLSSHRVLPRAPPNPILDPSTPSIPGMYEAAPAEPYAPDTGTPSDPAWPDDGAPAEPFIPDDGVPDEPGSPGEDGIPNEPSDVEDGAAEQPETPRGGGDDTGGDDAIRAHEESSVPTYREGQGSVPGGGGPGGGGSGGGGPGGGARAVLPSGGGSGGSATSENITRTGFQPPIVGGAGTRQPTPPGVPPAKPPIQELPEVKSSLWLWWMFGILLLVLLLVAVWLIRRHTRHQQQRVSTFRQGKQVAQRLSVQAPSLSENQQKIKIYLESNLPKGYSISDLSNALLQSGFSKADVDIVIDQVKLR